MIVLDALAAVLAAGPVLLLGIFTAEVLAGLRPLVAAPGQGTIPATTVLIPAHNEAAGIAATVAALGGRQPLDVLVVADNCSDDTAERARAAGARVVERHDPARRGKGFALAFGREAMAAAPPACVIVLDADCTLAGTGAAGLAQAAMASGRAVQARNLQRPDPTAPPTAQISSFAFLVKNLVRQRGMVRLGGVAALTGTGMALPWATFAAAPLASADLAEDLALGVWLTRRGEPPAFLESAHVWSDAAGGRDLLVQRNRWERGFLTTAGRQALPLVVSGLGQGSRSRLWLGLYLLVPPLALLFAASAGGLLLTASLAVLGASVIPLAVLAAALGAAVLATVLAWYSEGRAYVSGRALLQAPRYIAAKLPLYRGMTGRGQATWVRTRRAGEDERSD